MQITKNKLLKSTVAKVMAAAMVVTMMPVTVVNATSVSNDKSSTDDTATIAETAMPTPTATTIPGGTGGTTDAQRIKLTADVNLSDSWTVSNSLSSNIGKPLILDLDGHTITIPHNKYITVGNSELIICDSSTTDTKGSIIRGTGAAKADKETAGQNHTAFITVGSSPSDSSTSKGKLTLQNGKIIDNTSTSFNK